MTTTFPNLRLGKKPARPDAVRLRLATYLTPAQLPPIPAEFGHETLVTDWGMLANDAASCCFFSGAAHASMLWNAEAGRPVTFTNADVLADYGAVTGYDATKALPDGSNPTDQGTDVGQAMAYWQNTGIRDSSGARHKIGVSLALNSPATNQAVDVDQIKASVFLLDGTGIGINCPDQWLEAFSAGQPWGTVANPTYEEGGGHYIDGVCFRNGMFGLVTWGKVQWCAPAGLEQFLDEGFAVAAPERMKPDGVDVDGFAWAQLMTDSQALPHVV